MSASTLPFGDPRAAIRWSANLALDINHEGFFSSRFVGKGPQYCIEEKTELEGEAGDTVHFDLLVNLTEEPVFGDNEVAGTAEDMKHRSDRIHIDQIRHPVAAPGRMGRKRSVHNFRKDAKMLLKQYWAKFKDEVTMIYMAGARGTNEDFIMRQGWAGFANNTLRPFDASHQIYGGDAVSKASLTIADKMTRNLIETTETTCRMLRAANRDNANMQPLNINGAKHYVVVMSPFQEDDMRQDVGPSGWLTIAKDAAQMGAKNPIFTGGMGMVKNVVLHSHENVIRFNDYGVGNDVPAARALFLGAQAGVCAHGTKDKRKYDWHEEELDKGNRPEITAGTIWGMQRSEFAGRTFGCIAMDTYCKQPQQAA